MNIAFASSSSVLLIPRMLATSYLLTQHSIILPRSELYICKNQLKTTRHVLVISSLTNLKSLIMTSDEEWKNIVILLYQHVRTCLLLFVVILSPMKFSVNNFKLSFGISWKTLLIRQTIFVKSNRILQLHVLD